MDKKSIDPFAMYTPEEAATLMSVSRRTMYEWLRNGTIRPTKIGGRVVRVRGAHLLDPESAKYSLHGKTIFDDGASQRLAQLEYSIGAKLGHLPNRSMPWGLNN